MPSTQSVVMVALLPIPMKNCNIPQKKLDEEGQTNREVLNNVLRWLPQHLTFQNNPSAGSGYYNIRCCLFVFSYCMHS